MNASIQPPLPQGLVQPSGGEGNFSAGRKSPGRFTFTALLAGVLLFLFSVPAARAQGIPAGCTGSAIGISLFTSAPDVHIGDTLRYSVSVFNGLPGNPTSCDASNIVAWITTPDGVTNFITLRRTYLSHAQSDFYTNIVSYVVRAQDIRPDGTVRATADDTAIIYQNDTPSNGDAHQGVNTEVSLPCIGLTVQCVGSVGENGLITFTGTVTNCGNNTLVGVTVTNQNDNGYFVVFFPTNLLRGQAAAFSGSFVPLNPCNPDTVSLVARGVDQFTANPQTVTATANATCSAVLTPGLRVTKTCPPGPVRPGQLLTFSGSVSNTGNVTLTNIVVVNNQPAANTPVFTLASLAPGAVASFTGSYLAPTNCSVADTLTATAASRCGVGVSSVASATCPVLTTPLIAVTVLCPVNPAGAGGTLTYSGNVRNVGDTTLNNIVVVSDRPAANTTVFTVASLAPGASANFTHSITVPANACAVTTTFSGRGTDTCAANTATNTVSATCPIATAPAIAVTLTCPLTPAATGSLITYSGTVRNSGNVTLNNVTVVNNQASPSTVFTVASLAPGVTANFTASFTAPVDACSVSSTVTGSGRDNCTQTVVSNSASATCPLVTTPRLVVTQNCPANPASLGGLLTYSGTVSNAGNVTLTNVVVNGFGSGGTAGTTNTTIWVDDAIPAGGIINSEGGDSWNWVSSDPAPFSGVRAHKSNIAVGLHRHAFFSATDTLSVDVGDILVAYVYLDPANVPSEIMLSWADDTFEHRAYWGANNINLGTNGTASRRFMGPLPSVGQWVRLEVPANLVGLEGRTVSGMAFTLFDGRATWDAAGKATPITGSTPSLNNPVFTAASLAPGAVANFTIRYAVSNVAGCSFTSTLTAGGADPCTGIPVTASTSTTCPLATAPRITVTQICPVDQVAPGGLLTYSGTVSNAGNVALTNVIVVNNQPAANTVIFTVATLAPGATANFTGSYQVPVNCCVSSSTIRATGRDICTGVVVADTATRTCIVLTLPRLVVTKICTPGVLRPGDLLTYSGIVSNAGNIALFNVTVVNNQPGNGSLLLGPLVLSPGEWFKYTAAYIVPEDFCGTDTVTASGADICTFFPVVQSVTTTCPVITPPPSITVTKNCPLLPTPRGGLYTFTGSVSNAGKVTLVNVFVVDNQPTNNTPVIGPITLAPGASVNFSGSYIAPRCCCLIIDTLTARGQGSCTGSNVTATATAVCPVLTAPSIALVRDCPPNPIPMGSLYFFSGFVTNTGDVVLTNVFVFGPQGTNNPVLGPIELAPGQSEFYFGSYTVPSNTCSVPVTAVGQGVCSGNAVANTVECPVATTPLLVITQNCPVNPVSPGGPLTYSGSVSNAGNITIANVVVLNNLSGATPILTNVTLLPGAVTNFTGSYLAPTNCFTTSTSTATGRSICGVAVTNTVSATCSILTTPQITVTAVCPITPAVSGGSLIYNGTVRNTGNITLTNVVVVSDRPALNTTVFTVATLAPGVSTNFTSSLAVPINACSVTTTFRGTGRSICELTSVTNTVLTTCPILTAPAIAVTLTCPPVSGNAGGSITYTGTVRNAGNVTLNNVFVVNNQPGPNTPVIGPLTLLPGAVTSFTTSFIAPANACLVSSMVTGNGTDNCTAALVSNSASATCALITTPGIVVTQDCPLSPPIPGALLTFSGTVSNAGNITLTNVVVMNNLSGVTPVFTAVTLAPGGIANFTGSYMAPTNCTSTSLSTATGRSLCGVAVTNTASAICPITTTPLLAITQNCPINPVGPGGLLTFSGIVSNAGNVTLNNVVVTNNQTGNTPLLSVATLLPGASTNFAGSYLAPPTGPTTSTSTVRATSLCNVPVTNSASSTCAILTAPGIAVTKLCPPVPVPPGGILLFSGTVTNTGDVTLTNVVVVNNQPIANTPVLGPITLLAGAGASFTASYLVPLNACSVADTLTASGNSASTGIVIANNASATCTLITTPGITITESCPPGPVTPGSLVLFGGLVSNSGNITLTNVLVFSGQPSNTLLLGPITLAPGTSAPFTGSFIALGGSNPTTNSTILTNFSGTITTNFVSVITTNNTANVTTNSAAPSFGTIDPVSGTLTDRFNVSSNLHGLMFADQDQNWGPTLFYSTRHPGGGADQFVTISTIPPFVGAVTDRFSLTSTNYDALTLAAPDVGYGAVNFYYVRHDDLGVTTFGVIKAAGASSSADLWVIPGTGYTGLTFAAADVGGYGANMFYYVRRDVAGLSTFGTINPTPGGIATDRYTVGSNLDALVFVPSAVSTWGTALFAYLRHDDSGSIIGTINPVTHVATDRVDLGTNFLTALTFTATDVGYGPNLFYYLRPERTILTTNILTTFITNTVITFTTNTVTTFTTNSVVSFTPTNTVMAVGVDLCQARTVTASANCLGPVVMAQSAPTLPLGPILSAPSLSNDSFRLSFQTENGKSYTVQYKNSLNDPDWTDLETVVGTGGKLSISDAVPTERLMRFYRVKFRP